MKEKGERSRSRQGEPLGVKGTEGKKIGQESFKSQCSSEKLLARLIGVFRQTLHIKEICVWGEDDLALLHLLCLVIAWEQHRSQRVEGGVGNVASE